MCSVCGCAEGETRIEGVDHHHGHHHHDHHHGEHHHPHTPAPAAEPQTSLAKDWLHYGQGAARAHAPGLTQQRMVQIEQDILGKNDRYAAANREEFARRSLFALNLVSSPGSGKTSLLTRTLRELDQRFPLAVIEGDQQTSQDADRIRETGVQAVQVNTGKGCHLDAHMVGHALEQLEALKGGLLFIENVGNLVCPAAFDLGEAHKVAILSVTEGEDKPIKYPDMFHAADLLLLNKVDLLPHLDFDVEACIDYARRVKPDIQVIQVSARSGEGMQAWIDWLLEGRARLINQRLQQLEDETQALKALL
ncbi:hydrogenase nickel incorporation protein HypB [Marinospirillum perlucidum]|uniref:hydrogenase nickel incorporation protein HypB n=1 Tax=Marinospirillum perlucidum TaxID=1982602 RepID=UPI000DF23A8D|nr:hydrogenase nickel incorporation protein HypB [Marinospirillum perlucidum]